MGTQFQVKYPKAMAFILMLAAFIGLFGETALNMALSNVMDKKGPRLFVIMGSIIVLIGSFMFAAVVSATTPAWLIVAAFMVLFFGLTMVTMPAQTNALNQLPRELYADGAAAMNTLNQVAGAAGTALAITLFTAGQNLFAITVPDASQQEILAAGVKYTFYFITGVSIVGFLCSLFVKEQQKFATEPTTGKVIHQEIRT